MIKVKNLTKFYGKNKVLDVDDLEFLPNKIYGVIGRNGAGKTTLVNIITNRAFASSGDVEIDGEGAYENDRAQEKIFCITEKSAYPAIEKVSGLFKWAAKFYPNFNMEYAYYLAERFDLETGKKMSKLSTGYTTIAKVILTLASGAPYMIFDEPVLGIDAIYREIFYEELKAAHKKLNNCMVLATHILDEAETVIDDVIVLNRGKVAFNGKIKEITKKQSLQDFYLELHRKQAVDAETNINLPAASKLRAGRVDCGKVKHSMAYLFNLSWVQCLIVMSILAVFVVLTLVVPETSPSTEIMLWINLIVVGLVVHGNYFRYALYNGVSRKTYFIAMVSILLLCAVVMSIPATGVLKLTEHTGVGTNIVTGLYGNLHFMIVYLWFVLTNLLMLAVGLFSMVLFQALSRKGRYIAMVILIVVMLCFTLWGTLAGVSLANVFMFIGGLKPALGVWFAFMWIAILGTVFSVLSWLILRKTEIK